MLAFLLRVSICIYSVCPSCSHSGHCGLRYFGARITGGETAIPHSWPWQLSLRNSWRVHMCGATLINRFWAVTAAHCVKGSRYTVLAGAHGMYDKQGQIVRVSKIFVHEDYNTNNKKNDIALLKFSKQLTFSSRIHPACLPTQDQQIGYGDNCYITGWGRIRQGETGLIQPKFLHQSRVPLISHDQCRKVNGNLIDQKTMICVGGAGSSACYADSGGPLVCEQRGRWVLYGATSFGVSKICAGDKYSVYARVSNYIKWIEHITGAPIQPTQSPISPPPQSTLKVTTSPTTTMATSTTSTTQGFCRDVTVSCSHYKKHCKYNSGVQSICKKTCNKCNA